MAKMGKSFTRLLQISSVKDFSATDKMTALIRLNKGMRLRPYKEAVSETKAGRYTFYEKLFMQIFGNHALKVMALHQMLVMKQDTLVRVLSLNKKTVREEPQEIQDLYVWIDTFFLTQILNLDEQ
jgi:hypothetical protein